MDGLKQWRRCLVNRAAARWIAGLLTAVAAILPGWSTGQDEEKEDSPPTTFERLETRHGKVFLDCKVVRAEPDALIVKHLNGVARLAFLDLSRELREAYRYDPFAAVEHHQNESERQRTIRWAVFWDKQRHEASEGEKAEYEATVRKAKREWVPVRVNVLQVFEDGFRARCQRITFVKTKKRSKLGFIVDGPPKRVLVDFAGRASIILQIPAGGDEGLPREGGVWYGYVQPWPGENYGYRYRGEVKSAPRYRAIPR